MLKIFIRSALFFIASLMMLFLFIRFLDRHIRYNNTISEKIGWYLILPARSIKIGDLYTILISDKYMQIIKKLGYSADGTLLKRVVAHSGDDVYIGNKGVFINGVLLANSYADEEYKGINLYRVPIGFHRKLLYDEFWLMGETSTSFDSRYFGIVKRNQVLQVAYFLF